MQWPRFAWVTEDRTRYNPKKRMYEWKKDVAKVLPHVSQELKQAITLANVILIDDTPDKTRDCRGGGNPAALFLDGGPSKKGTDPEGCLPWGRSRPLHPHSPLCGGYIPPTQIPIARPQARAAPRT